MIPAVVALVFGQIAPLVDSICIGQVLGEEALSAISTVQPVFYLLNTIGCLFGIGAGVGISKASGAGEKERAGKIFTLSVLSMVVVSLIITVLFLLFSDQLLVFLCATEENFGYAKEYYTVLVAGMIFYVMNFAGVHILSNDNNANLAMAGGIVAGTVNMVIDVVGIFFLHQGIWVTAFGTVFGMFCGCLVYYLHFRKPDSLCRFVSLKKIKGSVRFSELIKPGRPEAAFYLTVTIQILMINYVLSSEIGTVGLSNSTVMDNLELVSTIVAESIAEAIIPLAASYFGEQNKVGLILAKRKALFTGVILFCPLALSLLIYPQWFIMLFAIDNQVMLDTLPNSIRLVTAALMLSLINTVLISYMSAVEKEALAERSQLIIGIAHIVGIYGFSRITPVYGPWISSLVSAFVGILYLVFRCGSLEGLKRPWKHNAEMMTGGIASEEKCTSWLSEAEAVLNPEEVIHIREKMIMPLLDALPKDKPPYCEFLILRKENMTRSIIFRYDSKTDYLKDHGIEETDEEEDEELPFDECIRSEFNFSRRIMMQLKSEG